MAFDSTPRSKTVANPFADLRSETVLRKLEPRIMFDAAMVETAIEAFDAPAPEAADVTVPADAPLAPLAEILNSDGLAAADLAALAPHLDGPLAIQAPPSATTIVFIDSNVPDLATLTTEIADTAEIVILDPAKDGLDQMASYLAGRHDLASIHILSHGEPGKLHLGSSVYDAASLKAFDAELGRIGTALSESGDILIYGCDVGAGAGGAAFTEQFAKLTGADVAASDDPTGAADKGGDWVLETISGTVDATAVASSSYGGLLAPLTITPVDGTTTTAMTVAQQLFGSNVTVVAATLHGQNSQAGVFSGASGYSPSWLAFDSGVIFATGAAASLPTTNTADNYSQGLTTYGVGGNADFAAIGGNSSHNASYIDVTFIPTTDRIALQFVFGSDEYNEFVYGGVADAMAVWVNGTNIAVTPNGDPIGVDTINQAGTYSPDYGVPGPSAAPSLFVNNDLNNGGGTIPTEMDGFTRTLGATITVNAGVENTIRIGISDIGDGVWDSWLLIKADSVQANLIAQNDTVGTTLNTPVTFAPLANDIDFDGDTKSIVNIADQPIGIGQTITLASGAKVLLNSDATLTVTPATGSTLQELFTYTITDGNGNTATAYVTVNVVSGTAPTLDLDASGAGTGFTTTYQIGGAAVAIADIDSSIVDGNNTTRATIGISNVHTGDRLTVDLTALPAGVTVDPSSTATSIVLVGDVSAATFAAAIEAVQFSNTSGSPSMDDRTIAVQVTDATGLSSNVATATILLAAPPVAADDTIVAQPGVPTTLDPRTNDSDLDGDALTITGIIDPVHPAVVIAIGGSGPSSVTLASGTMVTLLPSGMLEITVTHGVSPADTFSYVVSDGNGGTDSATVTLDVDTDSDGVADAADIDDDNDGILDVTEGMTGSLSGSGSSPNVFAAMAGSEAFARGAYVQVGINANGTFGADAAARPAGFVDVVADGRDYYNGLFGFIADVDEDGFAGSDYDGDYFVPGSPEEGFGVEIGGVAYNNNTNGGAGISGSITSVATSPTGDINWSGAVGGLEIDRTVSVTETGHFIRIETTLTNTTGAALNGIYWMHNVDPDNDVSLHNDFSTLNTIVSQGSLAADKLSLVTAQQSATGAGVSGGTEETGSFLSLLSFDERARVTFGGFSNRSPSGVFTDPGLEGTVGATMIDDIAVSIAFDVGTLAAGDSTTLVYYYNLDADPASIAAITQFELGRQTDNDGIADHRDIDSDDDGITDNVEAQTTAGYIAPSGTDTDGDGLDDAYDATVASGAAGSNGLAPVNSEGTDTADTIDTDSDNDGTADIAERSDGQPTVYSAGDTDHDGLADGFEGTNVNDGFDVNDENRTQTTLNLAGVPALAASGSNAVPLVTDLLFRDTNDAPVGMPADQASTDGGTVSIHAGAAFIDADGDDIDYVISGLPAGLTYNAETGVITGTLSANASQGGASGAYTVSVTAGDGTTATTTSFVLTVTNPPPVAGGDAATTSENVSVTVATPILGNDHDTAPDNDALTLASANDALGQPIAIGSEAMLPSGAKLTLNANGTYTYKPNGAFEWLDQDESTTDTFSYTISDGQGGTSNATVTVTIDGRNDAPQAGVLPNIAGKDGDMVSLDLGAHFWDADGEVLAYTIGGLPAGLGYDPATGLVTGQIDFGASQNGLFAAPGGGMTYLINVAATDGDSEITRVFQFKVTNPAPVAAADAAAADEDGPATAGDVLANDDDGATDGDTLTVVAAHDAAGAVIPLGTAVTLPSGAKLTLAGDGMYSYDPNGAFQGLDGGETATDSFTYTISDGQGGTSTATVTVTVWGANDAPVAVDNPRTLTEDASTPATGSVVADDDGLGADSDPDGEALTVTDVNGTAVSGTTAINGVYGVLTIGPDGTYSYALNNGHAAVQGLVHGQSLTDTFAYTAADGGAGTAGGVLTASAGLTITITGANDAPAVDLNSAASQSDTAVGNTVVYTEGDDPVAVASPAAGVSDFGEGDITSLAIVAGSNPDGAFEHVWVGGQDFDLSVDATKPATVGGSTSVTITFVAATGTFTVTEAGGGVLSQTALDALVGSVTYVNTDQSPTAGDRTLAFTATDAGGLTSAPAVATISVVPINDQPIVSLDPDAAPDFASTFTEDGAPVHVTAGTADIDDITEADVTKLTIVAGGIGDGTSEHVTIGGREFDLATDVTFAVVIGGTTFDVAYVASSGTVTVTAGASAAMDQADLDTLVQGISYENLSDNPHTNDRTLTFTATDAGGLTSDPAVATIHVIPTPDAVSDPITIDEDAPAVSFDPLANDDIGAGTDGIADVTITTAPTAAQGVLSYTQDGTGTVVMVADGATLSAGEAATLTFKGHLNSNGTVTIPYVVTDVNGATSGAEIVVSVTAVDDPVQVVNPNDPHTNPLDPGYGPADPNAPGYDPQNPTGIADPDNLIPDVTATDGATPASIPAGTYFGDAEGGTLTFAANGLPPGLTIDPVTGLIEGTLAANASQGSTPGEPVGTYVVVITAIDPNGNTASTTVTYAIGNLPPMAADDVAGASEDGPAVTGNALLNDHDTAPDGDILHVASVNGDVTLVGQPVAGSTGGSFVLEADGSWAFDPGRAFDNLAEGETRDTVLTYQVADGQGGVATASVTVTVTGANDAPVALGPIAPVYVANSTPVTAIDTSVAFANPGGLILTYTAGNLPAGLAIDPVTGIVSGTPVHNASVQGPYVVTVTATGPAGETSSVVMLIAVGNPGPVAAADIATTPANTSVTIAPLANDTDTDGDTLTVTSVTPPANGSATLNPDGTIFYSPDAGFIGTETISYTITDGEGGTSTSTIAIVVGMPPADAPVSNGPAPDQAGTDGQPIVPVDASAFVTDPDGGPLAFSASGLPKGLTIDPAAGMISGTPATDASANGPFTVLVTAVDPDGNQVTVPIVFAIANPAPEAELDYGATPADTPVTIKVLANDSDPDGDDLSVTYVSAPQNGAAAINPDGTVTYTPNAGFSGTDIFTYTVSDGQGGTSMAQAIIFVDQPMAILPDIDATVPTSASGTDGTPISPIDIGSHVTGQFGTLTYTATGLPAGLAIDPVTGIIGGILPKGASGEGPFTAEVTVVDGYGVQTTIPLVITSVNPAPVAQDDVAGTSAGQPVLIGVLANDTDPDGDALTVSGVTGPGHGNVAINPNGTIAYTPDAGFTGADTFTYTITDADGASKTATVTINVGMPAPLTANAAVAPVTGTDGQPATPVTVGLTFGDTDAGDDLTYSVDTTALPPGIVFDPLTGTFSGAPANDASQGHTPGDPLGTYVVPVTATDEGGGATTTFVTFTFANLAPVAADDAANPSEDGPVASGDVLGNDHDMAPDSDPLTVVSANQNGTPLALGTPVTLAGGGVLTLHAGGGYTFDPGTAYNGLGAGQTATETITYTISDGNGGTATAMLVIAVTGANDAPVVIDPANPVNQPGSPVYDPANPVGPADPANIIPDVAATDGTALAPIPAGSYLLDPDGEALVFALTPSAPAWLLIDPATGTITGTPPADASQGTNTGVPGEYLVTLTATDPSGALVSTTVTVSIANAAPVAANDAANPSEDGPGGSGDVLGNDHDTAPDGDLLTVVSASQNGSPLALNAPVTVSGGGVLTLHTGGGYTFSPGSAYNGLQSGQATTETIVYTVSDGNGGTATAMLTITVAGVNDDPVVVNPADPGTPDNPVPAIHPDAAFPVQGGTDSQPVTPLDASVVFKDPESGTLTYSATGLPPGLVIDPATGVISGTLDGHASTGSPYHVLVTAMDGHGGAATAGFDWAIGNPPPVTAGETATTLAGNPHTGTLAGNDSDPDGDPLHYEPGTPPAHGSVVISPDGTYTYTPAPGFSGTDTFTYKVVDSDGGVTFASVTVTVNPGVNITQIGGGSGAWQPRSESSLGLLHVQGVFEPSVNDYLRKVSSLDPADPVIVGGSEHIRLVVEGRTHQLDQQYGAASNGAPLHWSMGFGRERGPVDGGIAEPLADMPFWHGLEVLDFSGLDLTGAQASATEAQPQLADVGVSFGDRLAAVRARFDREARALAQDLGAAA